MDGASWVLAGAASFVGTHLAMSHPLRRPLVARLDEGGFAGFYSLASFITLGLAIWAYVVAPVTEPAWSVGNALWAVATALMLVGSILLMGSLIRNPALPNTANQAATAEAPGSLRHNPSSNALVVCDLGRQPHSRLADRQEHFFVGRDHFPVAGRSDIPGSKKGEARSGKSVGLEKPHELFALRRHCAEKHRVRRLWSSCDHWRKRSLARGDLGAYPASGMASRHMAVGRVGAAG